MIVCVSVYLVMAVSHFSGPLCVKTYSCHWLCIFTQTRVYFSGKGRPYHVVYGLHCLEVFICMQCRHLLWTVECISPQYERIYQLPCHDQFVTELILMEVENSSFQTWTNRIWSHCVIMLWFLSTSVWVTNLFLNFFGKAKHMQLAITISAAPYINMWSPWQYFLEKTSLWRYIAQI